MDLRKFDHNLAEIAGIHVGDGYLRNDGHRIEWDISGSIEEKEYYDKHMIPLFNRVFKLDMTGRFFPSRSTYGFCMRKKEVIEFANKYLGFPYGNKSTIISVPQWVLQDKGLYADFLRGYFDTDGNLSFEKKEGYHAKFKRTKHWYPRIHFSTVSKSLSNGIIEILTKLRFNFVDSRYQPKKTTESLKYRIDINGIENVKRWLQLVDIKNKTKYSRYLIWKKFGFCPTNISYQQRIDILNGKINPESFYKGP